MTSARCSWQLARFSKTSMRIAIHTSRYLTITGQQPVARGPSNLRSAAFNPLSSESKRTHHSSSPNSEASTILSAALVHVPEHGFSPAALSLGARDAGYLDASVNLFPRGPLDLIDYHLMTQRLALETPGTFSNEQLGVGAKVRALTLQRLRGNKQIIHRWQEALALLSAPSNLLLRLRQLAQLSDAIWHLAGDTSVDSSWYTKRATLSAIYSSTELFMTTDTSPDFLETERFLDRRLEELKEFGQVTGAVSEWLRFTGRATVNVARSKGLRI